MFESEIATLLDDLTSVQDELFIVLREKRERMASRTPQAIMESLVREEMLCERLQSCHTRRAEILKAATESGIHANSLGDLAASVERRNDGQLRKQVKETGAKMRLLQNETLANWVLAQRALLHISQLLEIIATGGRLQPTYFKGESVHARGALVDREA
jgi:hypothetical protein